tara:strand:+ start:134 stop:961 length:828 start_codon:yes stop_codon:yes gene_type:complete
MSKITWIASYPKSGNTWIRIVVFCALRGYLNLNELGDFIPNFSIFPNNMKGKDFDNQADIRYKWLDAQKKLTSENKNNIILKTHISAGKYDVGIFPSPECTLNALYIVRDPRDVAVSYSKHFNTSISDAVRRMMSETHILNAQDRSVGNKGAEFTSSWENHVTGWKNASFPVLFIKYEDLLEYPAQNISKLLEFMNIQPQISIEEIVKLTNFSNLVGQETDSGFGEASPHTRFFRKGAKAQWKKIPSKSFQLLENKCHDLMTEFGYKTHPKKKKK